MNRCDPLEWWGPVLKALQLATNFIFIGFMSISFYRKEPHRPLTSGAWPVEVLLMLSLAALIFELFLLQWVGCRKLTGSLMCLFSQVGVVLLIELVQIIVISQLEDLRFRYISFFYLILLCVNGVLLNLIGWIALRRRSHIRKRAYSPLRQFLCRSGSLPSTESSCTICLESLRPSRLLIALPCNERTSHYFHFNCFTSWHTSTQSCPICRSTNYLHARANNQRPTPSLARAYSGVSALDTERLSFAQP